MGRAGGNDLRSSRRGGMRLAVHIAARDALQHRGRSILIVVLVALPIVALSGFATISTSNIATPAEQVRDAMGANQAELTVVGGPNPKLVQSALAPDNLRDGIDSYVSDSGSDPVALPSAYLPAGTRILTLRDVAVVAKTASGIGGLSAVQGEPWDRSFAGRFEVLSGHRPTTDSEIMATPAALTRLGAQVGSTVSVSQPRAEKFTIVGTMRDLTTPTSTQRLFGREGAFDTQPLFDQIRSTRFFLPDHEVSWPQVQQLNRDGIAVMSRAVFLNPPPLPETELTGVQNPNQLAQGFFVLLPFLGFTLFEVALLAGAAFMVGTKQQQRGLATLASVGGDRRMLSRVVSYAGIVLGLAGGILGSAFGIVGAAVFMSISADGDISRYPGLHVNPLLAAGIVAFAVIAGWVAALVPARVASRVDVVAALRGALRPAKPSRKTPVIGIAVALLGAAITIAGCVVAVIARGASAEQRLGLAQLSATLIVVGPVLLQIAALIIAPLVLRAVARLLSRLGTGPRLASRDAARNASRSVPAIGAIMSTVFVASFFMTYIAASQAQETQDWTYSAPQGTVQASIQAPGATPAQISSGADTLRTTMQSVLGRTGAVTLLQSMAPDDAGDPSKDTGVYAVAVANPHTRCRGAADGSDPRAMTIASNNCAEPNNLVYPRLGYQLSAGTPHALEVASGTTLSSAARATLDSGGIVAFVPGYLQSAHVTIAWLPLAKMNTGLAVTSVPEGSREVTVAATTQTVPHQTDLELGMLPATAKSIGLVMEPRRILLTTGIAPTDQQRDALTASAQSVFSAPDAAAVFYESGPPTTAGAWAWILLTVCAVIALGAAGVALGLARSDGRRNEAILGSLGAPPLLRRSFGFWSGAVITGIGAIGGVLLGTVPAIAVAQSFLAPNGGHAAAFALPWPQLAVTAIGLPLVLAVASWLTSGRARVRYNERAPIG